MTMLIDETVLSDLEDHPRFVLFPGQENAGTPIPLRCQNETKEPANGKRAD
jgi:hypothetical protein